MKISPVLNDSIQFEIYLSKQQQPYLSDHRVRNNMVFPLAGYLEMALAAAINTCGNGQYVLANIEAREALVLLEEGERAVQLVLTSQLSETLKFEVLGCPSTAQKRTQFQTLHVNGEIHGALDTLLLPQVDSMEVVRSRCSESVSVDEFYHQLRERSVEHGPMFQGTKQIYRRNGEALSQIELPIELADEAQYYHIHPALLDAGLQALAAAIPLDAHSTDAYIPVSVEGFTLYRKPDHQLWSHAYLRSPQGEKTAATFEGDIRLLDEKSQLVAEVKGLRLQRVETTALVGTEPLKDSLYQIHWQLKSPLDQPFQRSSLKFLPPLSTVVDQEQIDFDRIATRNNLPLYLVLQPQLEMLANAYILEALQQLGWLTTQHQVTPTDALVEQLGIVSKQRPFFERLLSILAERDIFIHLNSGWQQQQHHNLPPSETLYATIETQFNICRAELALLKRCGDRLAQVLSGQCDPLALLFPDGSAADIEQMYRQSPELSTANGIIEDSLAQVLAQLPQTQNLRILEIGGGTGTTTSYMLPLLPLDRTDYVFTDVSSQFTTAVQERFRSYSCVRYAVLDIEEEPRAQGFAHHQFDIIVAANVFHATADLRQTLRHVRQLLASDGLLVIMEATHKQGWADLIFGLTEGWWKFLDYDLRPTHPLLSQMQWQDLLQEMEFSEVTALPKANELNLQPLQSVFLARGPGFNQLEVSRTNEIQADLSQKLGKWLIFADNEGVGIELGHHLSDIGALSIVVKWGDTYKKLAENLYQIDPANPHNFQQLLADSFQGSYPLQGIVHLWSLDSPSANQLNLEQLQQTQVRSCGSVLHLIQAIAKTLEKPPRLWLITQGTQQVTPQDTAAAIAQAPLWGMARTIAHEHPELNCTVIDLDVEFSNANTLLQQLVTSDTEQQVALRRDGRYVPRLIRLNESETPLLDSFGSDATYLITGGLRGLGLEVARWMVNRGARYLTLMGRNYPSAEAQEAIAAMEAAGVQVHIAQADVSQPEQLIHALQTITESLPPLRGIIHCAGILNDRVLLKQDWASFNEVLAPKVYGTWNLHSLARTAHLEFFTFFSSIASLLGAPGQSNHAAANAFEDALAYYRRAVSLPATSINWGAWDKVGIAAQYDKNKQLIAHNLGSISPEQGLTLLSHLFKCSLPQVSVLYGDRLQLQQMAPAVSQSPLLNELNRQAKDTDEPSKPTALKTLTRENLLSAQANARLPLLQNYLQYQVARVLRLEPNTLQFDQPLYRFGLDSLMAIELKNRFEADLEVTVPLLQLIEDNTIIQLSTQILNQLMTVHADSMTDLQTETLLNNLENLSDTEVDTLLNTLLTQVKEK